MNNFKIHIETQDNPAVEKALLKGLKQFNEAVVGPYHRQPFVIYSKNDQDILGGIKGEMFSNICAVHLVWVAETVRNQGLGTALMSELESLARSEQCDFIQLDTAEFQARVFYEKNGYSVIATLPNNFKGYKTYIMRKTLR